MTKSSISELQLPSFYRGEVPLMDSINKTLKRIRRKLKYHTNWGMPCFLVTAFMAVCIVGTLDSAVSLEYWYLWMLVETVVGAIFLAFGFSLQERYYHYCRRVYRRNRERQEKVNRNIKEIKRQRIACKQVSAVNSPPKTTRERDDSPIPKFMRIAP